MRAGISTALNQAANADSRRGVARLILRDTLLRFSQVATPLTNPWALTAASLIGGESYCAGAALALSTGTIVRAWCSTQNGQSAQLRINIITDPTVTAQWSTWVTAKDGAGAAFTCDANCNPGLAEYGSGIYVYYTVGGVLKFRGATTASGGAGNVWGAEQSTLTPSMGTNITLSVSSMKLTGGSADFRVFGCSVVSGAIRIYARVFDLYSGSWQSFEMPWFQDGYQLHPVTATAYDSTTFFTALELGGRTFVIYSFGPDGSTHIVEFTGGVWGNPAVLIPNDYSNFRPYRATVIQGRAWLSGRLERNNEAAYSPAWETYLYSDDGENWTAGSIDSFIIPDLIHGQLLLAGGRLYYAGLGGLTSATATWLVDPAGDPAVSKLVLGNSRQAQWLDTAAFGGLTATDDIISAKADFPGAGTGPTLSLDLANGDESWYHGAKDMLLQPLAELTLQVGYVVDGAGTEEYATVAQASLDSVGQQDGLGTRNLQVSARDTLFKRMKDYASLFYWPFQSQLKHVDNCNVMGDLVPLVGNWDAKAINLLYNSSFETEMTQGWISRNLTYEWGHAGAGVMGTIARTQEVPAQDGDWCLRLEKTDGVLGNQMMLTQSVTLYAGRSYTLKCAVQAKRLAGGTQSLTLRATGNVGAGGSLLTVDDTHVNPLSDPGTGDTWVTFSVAIAPITTGWVAFQFIFLSVTTGLVYLDTCSMADDDLQISFGDDNIIGVATAQTPPDTVDFDIRATWMDESVPAADWSVFGLVGGIVDRANYFGLNFNKVAGGAVSIVLFKIRGGVGTLLAASYTYPWLNNTLYDLRMVHRQGHIWCYVKLHSATSWTGPLFTSAGYDHFVWDPSVHGQIIPSVNGRGQVGVRAYRKAKSFAAMATENHATVIPLNATNDGDWATFPSSGQVMWGETEICSYARRTPGAGEVFTIQQPENWGGVAARSLDAGNNWTPLGWWWTLWAREVRHLDGTPLVPALNFGLTDPDPSVFPWMLWPRAGLAATTAGYCVVFNSPDLPGAAWEILMSRDHATYPSGAENGGHSDGVRFSGTGGLPLDGPSTVAWNTWAGGTPGAGRAGGPGLVPTLLSGYEGSMPAKFAGTQDGGPGGTMGMDASGHMNLSITPCLGGVTRGLSGTKAIDHAAGETVRVHYQGHIRLFEFRSHDLATDWNSERLLKRACALAGVTKTEFNSAYTTPLWSAVTSFSGIWSGYIFSDSTLSVVLHRHNFDYSCSFPALTGSQGFAFQFHTDDALARGTPMNTSGRHIAIYLLAGQLYCEYGPGGIPYQAGGQNPLEVVKIHQLTTVANKLRLVVNKEWTTVYLNQAYVAAFYNPAQDLDSGQAVVQWYISALGGTVVLADARIPELDDWRDALRFDQAEDVISFIGQVTEDRPYFFISRSGQSIKFSTFALRTLLTPNDNPATPGSFGTRFLEDQYQVSDNGRYSLARVEAIGILEFLRADLASQYGFITKLVHMTRAENPLADAMTQRSLQLMQEALVITSEAQAANLRFEPEDTFNTIYTDPATGTVSTRSLIVNDLSINFDAQGLFMQMGARQRIA